MDDLISKLSEIRSDYNCFNEDEEPQYRALSEAIRILSQRADGDTISRQAAIERATKDHDFYKGATTPADMARRDELLNVMCWLGELPPAQPERKRGKWIYHPDWEDDGECPYECSECGMGSDYTTNYCPRCGADMRGEQDDESRSNSNAQTDTRARGMGAADKSSGI